MPSTILPVHETVTDNVPFLRNALEDVYVVSHENGKLFHLKTLSITDEKHPEACDPGWVVKKNGNGEFEEFEIDDSVKAVLTEDPELIKCLNTMVVDSCTGKTNYDVAWWAGDFNRFMQGFCNRNFDV